MPEQTEHQKETIISLDKIQKLLAEIQEELRLMGEREMGNAK